MASDSILSLLFRQECSESEDEESAYRGVIPETGASEQPVALFFQEDSQPLHPAVRTGNDELVPCEVSI